MEEMEFDRQAFVTPTEPPRRPASSLLGPVLFLFVVGLIGLAGYAYWKGNGLPVLDGGDPQLAAIAQKLEEIEKRLDKIEKRRKPSAAESSPNSAPAKNAGVTPPPPPFVLGDSAGLQSTARPITPSNALAASRRQPGSPEIQQELESVRTDLASTREVWEATTDRLGRAVGELGAQRAEIARNRERLGQFLINFERTRYSFQLGGNSGSVRVGPVWLQLRDTNRKKQRYTLGLFLDDRWVEVKDRALHEPVEFYLSDNTLPLELVITQIGSGQVTGHVSVPKQAPAQRNTTK